jgi:hypothetical protein
MRTTCTVLSPRWAAGRWTSSPAAAGRSTPWRLAAGHPEQVRTLVAHEPPATYLLPDREQALAAAANIHETYMRDGFGRAMAKFIALTSLKGPIPADFAARPAPNPAELGLPTEDDGARDDPLLGNIANGTDYEFDFDALRAAPTRIVIAAGAESEGELTHRAALAVAERLGTEAVIFPSHHAGFLGGEFGMRGEPEAFAATLRQVLTEDGSDDRWRERTNDGESSGAFEVTGEDPERLRRKRLSARAVRSLCL